MALAARRLMGMPLSGRHAACLHSILSIPTARVSPGSQRPAACLSLDSVAGAAASLTSTSATQKEPLYDALMVDVGGTLLETAQPVPRVYAEFGRKHGIDRSEDGIKAGFRRAFSTPWHRELRYEGSGEEFWRYAVATAMGSDSDALFRDLYKHFSHASAWTVADGAVEALRDLKSAGVKLAVVSNFDTRLRPILRGLEVDSLFDAIVVSCEVLSEKPSPAIFLKALEELELSDPSRVVHLGDDPLNDLEGAQRLGLAAWLWKKDVGQFSDVRTKILLG